MNTILESARDAWLRIETDSPAVVKRTLIPLFNDYKEVARLLADPSLPVVELTGQTPVGPLTATFINVKFNRNWLERTLFSSPPEEKKRYWVPFWHTDEISGWRTGDILLVAGTRHLIDRLPKDGAIVMPEFVHHAVDVSGDWDQVQARFHRDVRNNVLRRIRKYGFEFATSRDPADFEDFFQQMYLPTMAARHGGSAWPMGKSEARRYLAHGFMLKVLKDGVWVAGSLSQIDGDTLVGQIIGVRQADARLMDEGAMEACYLGNAKWANQNGLRYLSLAGSDPCLESGIFQYKRKWGSTVSLPDYMFRRFWLRVRRDTPAVRSILGRNSLITLGENGTLHGLLFVDDLDSLSKEKQDAWLKRYATPGLSSLCVRAFPDFTGVRGRERTLPLDEPGYAAERLALDCLRMEVANEPACQ